MEGMKQEIVEVAEMMNDVVQREILWRWRRLVSFDKMTSQDQNGYASFARVAHDIIREVLDSNHDSS
jgi:hypothetical protein